VTNRRGGGGETAQREAGGGGGADGDGRRSAWPTAFALHAPGGYLLLSQPWRFGQLQK
jgi:hypothetical protein